MNYRHCGAVHDKCLSSTVFPIFDTAGNVPRQSVPMNYRQIDIIVATLLTVTPFCFTFAPHTSPARRFYVSPAFAFTVFIAPIEFRPNRPLAFSFRDATFAELHPGAEGVHVLRPEAGREEERAREA